MAANWAAQARQRARNNAQSPPASSGKSQEKRRFWGENRGSTAPSCIGGKVNADLRRDPRWAVKSWVRSPRASMRGDARALAVVGGDGGCRLLLADDRGRYTLEGNL